jgi:hypothetical protein
VKVKFTGFKIKSSTASPIASCGGNSVAIPVIGKVTKKTLELTTVPNNPAGR